MFMLSTAITFVYFVIRFIQIRQNKEDEKPSIKSVMKDTLIVFTACILGIILLEQISPYLNETKSTNGGGKSPAFTDDPNF